MHRLIEFKNAQHSSKPGSIIFVAKINFKQLINISNIQMCQSLGNRQFQHDNQAVEIEIFKLQKY
jgi:hypothetical protein